jgi:multicomponent Na+:H+ antiporter subunit D
MSSLPPGLILVLGSLLLPLLRGRLLQAALLLLPLASGAHLLTLSPGESEPLFLFDYALTPVRIDALSLCFGYVFHIAAFLSALFALHSKDRLQHMCGLSYAGSAIGAVFAGDLVTLFVYWELTAITSVFLIWASGTERSFRAGIRYLVIQVGSGVLLLAGILLRLDEGGGLAFGHLADEIRLDDLPTLLIFLAFGIKCAFPLLHNWLQDSYPKGTITGTVFLSAFTTKLAVYALARGFAGVDLLIPIGAVMTIFPIFFAVIENDLRKVLAYSLNNQLGFMVVGIGVGTAMAINGAVAHAFAHILYKGLLFMSMGAVLYRTGTIQASKLGGLYRSMPWTAAFCIIGAMSISAFPLFSGFIAKGLTITAVADGHHTVTWFVLLVASAGVMEHSGIKIPYFSFFGHDSGIRCKEAPWNMLAAMGIAAAFCIGIGVFPGQLYSILPNEVEYLPYTGAHVVTQLQLLLFAVLAFVVLMRTGLYPPELPSENLDTDWTYRRLGPRLATLTGRALVGVWSGLQLLALRVLKGVLRAVMGLAGPEGLLARTWATGSIALWAVLVLGGYLVLHFW